MSAAPNGSGDEARPEERDPLFQRSIDALAEQETRTRDPRRAERLRSLRHGLAELEQQIAAREARAGQLPCPVCGEWDSMEDLVCSLCGAKADLEAINAHSGLWKVHVVATVILVALGIALLAAAASTGSVARWLLGLAGIASLVLSLGQVAQLGRLIAWIARGRPKTRE
jgi:hypothetical protein